MQHRVIKLLGRTRHPSPLICTFHSLCVRILRRHIERLGYPRKFVILDRGDQESYARGALRELRIAEHVLSTADLLWSISRWKSHGILAPVAERTADSEKQRLAAAAYRRYNQALFQAGSLDFDDLLLCTEQLFREHPGVLAAESRQWHHLLIDEYQDTNSLQYQIVRQLAGHHRNVCAVGDDDQSIYGWRGASVRHILDFRQDWTEAKVVRLEENYRSSAQILEFANRLIAHNRRRHEKTLRPVRGPGPAPRILQMPDETREASDIVRQIGCVLQRPEVDPCDIAVLFRTNEQPRPFETELRKASIPYILVGGQSFFDRKEVKDLLAYFRLIDNPADELSARRIINTPPRGIGKATVKRAAENALQSGQTFWEALTGLDSDLTPSTRQGIEQLVQLIREQRHELARHPDLVHWATRLIERLRYRSEIDRLYAEAEERQARWASIEQVVNALGQYASENGSQATLSGFIDQVAVGDNDLENEKEKQLSRNAIVLMTLHSAKGLEFPYVYMVGLEEGVLPHQRSIDDGEDAVDEERRLCYVGITRACEQLTLSLPLSRMKWGKPKVTRPSRFLYEMTDQTANPDYAAAIAAEPVPIHPSQRPSTSAAKLRRRRKERPKKSAR
jgi:DNA helicase-2/ATP-dependent DNA helicase PcrA